MDQLEMIRSMTRRHFFGRASRGIGALALASVLDRSLLAAPETELPTTHGVLPRLHHAPKAKRIIYLFQSGAPSQLDLFDYKPKLVELSGQPMPESFTQGQRIAQLAGQKLVCVGTKYKFQRHGQSGAEISELFPHLAGIVDDIAIVKSIHTDAINHDPAVTLIQTGGQQPGRPTMGAWFSYGLGSENDQLPAFVVLTSGGTLDQPLLARYWGSGFLPSSHQGVEFRSSGDPILFVSNPKGITPDVRRRMLDSIHELNGLKLETAGDPEIETRIKAYEMAYRMQTSVPELMDLSDEPQAMLDLYGAKPGEPSSYANNCLLARRLAERGVRFVQLYHRGWDQHNNLPDEITRQCAATDQATAALIKDLKQRGLFEDTLVIWGGEFGRTPMNQGEMNAGNYGRDHHMKAFAIWMAGGGIKGGVSIGATDELGYNVVEDPVHINDFQATVMHCMGVDHKRLTYRFQGRDFRLTDVGGNVIQKILA
ncbi:MAG: DUF1501 domain-containing protein [Candidatus Omnitrophica bacterium]|nr:hypothetical protein [bacterium]NUN96190.1 DUF1501 domain-containing protein [Candidatus Omnitrophota bacterium]